MATILTIIFAALASFVVMDYTLGRFTVRENIRLGVAIGFSILFTIFVVILARDTLPGLV